jgi:hypothetical protein|tara:strand:- start:6066 stop:6245 length:180 start_codon:yes stop_codon:yes gene_type:complete
LKLAVILKAYNNSKALQLVALNKKTLRNNFTYLVDKFAHNGSKSNLNIEAWEYRKFDDQ